MEEVEIPIRIRTESLGARCVRPALSVLVLLLVIAGCLIGLLAGGILKQSDEQGIQRSSALADKPCLTEPCVKVAGRILRDMDQNADPCEDFFQYACGGYQNENYIPNGEFVVSPMLEMEKEVISFFKDEFSFGITDTDPIAFKNLREFYLGCMAGTVRDQLGLAPLKAFVNNIGGLNYTRNWNGTTFDLTDMLITMALYQSTSFFQIKIRPDGFNRSVNTILLNPPVANFRSLLLKKEEDMYPEYVQTLTTYYGSDSFSLEQVSAVVNLTSELIKPLRPMKMKISFAEAFTNRISLEELYDICDAVDWVRLFQGIFKRPIDKSYELYVYDNTYFERLSQIIKRTKPDVINDFLLTGFIINYALATSGVANSMPLVTYLPPSDISCFRVVSMLMRPATEALFMKKYYKGPIELKERVKEIIEYVQRGFLANQANSDWLDDATWKLIEEKALDMGFLVSHANVLLNLTAVNGMSSKILLSRLSYFDSFLAAAKTFTQLSFSTVDNLWMEVLYWSDLSNIALPNAIYRRSGNIFQIPAGIIDEPFYTVDAPKYINFGSLGSTAGHELTHGFDTIGGSFDLIGRMIQWWTNSSTTIFQEKAKCFIDQFNNMTIHNARENKTFSVDGLKTLSENIADAGGIRAAFRGYQAWREANGNEPVLPGMPTSMTWQKLFFLAAVQPFCHESKADFIKIMVKYDSHTPGSARVNGWVINSDEFSSAYQCAKRTTMNPKEKCRIW